MKCDYCGKMQRGIYGISFVDDGRVDKVINMPKRRAKCTKCQLAEKKPKPEVATEEAPF